MTLYVKQRGKYWHISKIENWDGADAICDAEPPDGYRLGWRQCTNEVPENVCPVCQKTYDDAAAFEASWPMPYTCQSCGEEEDSIRFSCDWCHKRICCDCVRIEHIGRDDFAEVCPECATSKDDCPSFANSGSSQ